MRNRLFATAATTLIAVTALLALVGALGRAAPGAPTVTEIKPASGPNDLDTSVVITGTGFSAGLSGTLVITQPMVTLGDTALENVSWISTTKLEAAVPWGLDSGVYTLTVENPDGGSASLTDAFTVTEAIGVWNAAELYGGHIGQVAVVSQTPQTLYAVSEDVGMFRSEDGAETWSYQVAGSVGNLAVSPVSPTVLYISVFYELHRSDDGGDTWKPLDAPGGIPFPHPIDSGTLFVGDDGEDTSGLWKSTNYGQTWQAITETHGLTDTRVTGLVFDPTDPMTIYVGTGEGNLFVSSDGGDFWSFVDHPLEYIQTLGINPRGDHELWVSNMCFSQPQRTLKSTNISHTTWMTVADPVGSVSLTSIEFAPDGWGTTTYSQTLFVSSCWGNAYHSDNAGASWSEFGSHSGGWGLALHPTDPDIAYRGSGWDGVIKTTDGGSSWEAANEGLTAVVPDQMATAPGEPGTVYAVSDIGLLKGTQGGAAWQSLSVPSGDARFVATDPFTPDRVYVVGADVDDNQAIHISEDGGQTWSVTSYLMEPAEYDQYAHLDPFVQPDPSQPGVLLAGVRHTVIEPGGAEAGSLYRSTDAGLTWSEVDVGQPISPVQDIAFDALTPTIVYMATGSDWHHTGGLLRSTDGGTTWERIDDPALGQHSVESVAVEPDAPYRVVIRTGWPDMASYVSDDHGASGSWTKGGFANGDLLFTQGAASTLYGTSTSGLFRSTDAGLSWTHASGALGQVPVYSLTTVTDTDRVFLYAGTTGGRVVDQTRGLALLDTAVEETMVSPGVYRYTSLRSQQAAPGQPGWVQVADGGFGDPANFILRSLASFDGDIYAGTRNNSGAELWQSDNGSTWQQVASAWSPTNTAILALQSYGPHLYLGTATESGVPGEIWRSDDGANWTAVLTDGFGDPDTDRVRSMIVFSNTLYAGVENTATGLGIWRSESGDPGTWSQVNADSFGEAGIAAEPRMVVFSDTLYVGVSRDGLAELWRSGDGVTWTPVFTDGLGNPENQLVYSLAEFKGDLYVGTLNFAEGGEVWQFDGDESWTKILDGGAGNPDNVGVSMLEAFGQQLHAVFHNNPTGAEAWQSADGTTWERTNLNGWGDSNNGCFGAATVFDHALYVGTINGNGGAEVWRYGFKIHLPLVLRSYGP